MLEGVGGGTPESLADITDHLLLRFRDHVIQDQVAVSTVARIVRHCHRELVMTGQTATLGAVQLLATRRLADRLEHESKPARIGRPPRLSD